MSPTDPLSLGGAALLLALVAAAAALLPARRILKADLRQAIRSD